MRTVFEPRADETGPYVWATATFQRSGADGTQRPTRWSSSWATSRPTLVAALAAPLAVRDLGLVDAEQRAELGLDDSEEQVTVELDGESHVLRIGGVVFASGDRYVEMVEDGRVYVITARDINGLQNGSSILVERRVVRASPERLAEVTLLAGTRTRTMRKAAGAPDAPPAWTNPDAPDRVDESFGTFMERLGRLSINRYAPEVDPTSLASWPGSSTATPRAAAPATHLLRRRTGPSPNTSWSAITPACPRRSFATAPRPSTRTSRSCSSGPERRAHAVRSGVPGDPMSDALAYATRESSRFRASCSTSCASRPCQREDRARRRHPPRRRVAGRAACARRGSRPRCWRRPSTRSCSASGGAPARTRRPC